MNKALIHYLIDHPELNLASLPTKVAALGAKVENALEKRWLFDFDAPKEKIQEFVSDLHHAGLSDNEIETHETPNGYGVIIAHGFDTRELLEKWTDVSLKRDDLLCIDWLTKEE
ncbi:hypothetical protein D7I46_01540 [Lactococcus allomyrinae]|uniref:Uncharacterized protein n=1 Tax=Lactococcus allomyrinae TaxID=2419773 RepID=A0A387BLI8_9LACT|nr:hypothetical protein D7I46_01540 [Lactococcus allomyrinae]